MARGRQKSIYLKEEYPSDYRIAVWRRFVELFRRARYSRRQFFDYELASIIDNNLDRIKADFDNNYEFEYPKIDADRTLISHFLAEGQKRKFNAKIFWMFDAYVQLASPKFSETLQAKDDLEKMGEIVGYFLRDPHVGELGYLLAEASQKLLHFFSYDNIDTIGSYDETKRFLCLFAGETPDYIFALDFAFLEEQIVFLKDEKLRLYYGFCAPGEGFSPLIMRSYCLRERLAGLLYAKSALINLQSERLNSLTFEVFTTDKTFHGKVASLIAGDSPQNIAFSKALAAHKGLKLARTLSKIPMDSSEYRLLSGRIRQFKVDFL